MKDLSCFILKNSLAFNMKKSFKNPCTGDASTSTLNQKSSPEYVESHQQPPTLEEMIMQLDLEEKLAATTRPSVHHRMSCVNSSDILRSALNHYPRFSLDGKDAMYRSSFRPSLPAKVAGERVIWCKPGVVAKLMGLEAMPIPLRLRHKMKSCIARTRTRTRTSTSRNHGSCSQASTRHKPVSVTDQVGWPMGRFM
ncbi:hypothetical protein R6Q59_002932 [Mikania micrantha]|uniref:DUF3741 domain-containing protein n=1 Tax=Mikania micrantha TaxID=192012 RepID=A0A5N6NQY7_9ASTR|nr:hypothetical protein E3N88_19935 [Mikania micrantha]